MLKKIKKLFYTWIQAWDQFWFKPIDTLPLACFRFCVCSVLFVTYSIRFFDIRLFFYESGLLSSDSAKAFQKIETEHVLHFILSSDAWLYMAHLALLVALLLMALGIGNRLLSVATFFLHLIFIQRNPSIVYGLDSAATFWLFYLMLAKVQGQMQWIHYFFHKRKTGLVLEKKDRGYWGNQIVIRLIQIQLCVMYLFSGLYKLKGHSWWEGTALWEALSFYDLAPIDFSFLLGMPVVVAGLTWFVFLFELYFPVLIWIPKLRNTLLSLGLLMHILIAVSMGLYLFALIVLCAYLLFISPQTLKNWISRLEK